MTTAGFPTYLTDYYTDIRPLPGNKYAAINRLLFTCAIIVGKIDYEHGFSDRWCYSSYRDAKEALDNWNGEGEPEGWHRNPITGRRKNENGEEYVSH